MKVDEYIESVVRGETERHSLVAAGCDMRADDKFWLSVPSGKFRGRAVLGNGAVVESDALSGLIE